MDDRIQEAVTSIVKIKDKIGVPEGKHAVRIEECNEAVLAPILQKLIDNVFEDIQSNAKRRGSW